MLWPDLKQVVYPQKHPSVDEFKQSHKEVWAKVQVSVVCGRVCGSALRAKSRTQRRDCCTRAKLVAASTMMELFHFTDSVLDKGRTFKLTLYTLYFQ